jgi:hypothetical protein
MIKKFQKYKTFEEVAADYKPMRFKFKGVSQKERLPKATLLLKPSSAVVRQFKELLGFELTYFDLRPSMTPEQRKMGDLTFLTHYSKSHDGDAENGSRVERAHYYWLRIRYLAELMHINGHFYDKQGQPTLELPQHVEMYLLRWHYLLSVQPDFVELVHGMEANRAKQSVSHLL